MFSFKSEQILSRIHIAGIKLDRLSVLYHLLLSNDSTSYTKLPLVGTLVSPTHSLSYNRSIDTTLIKLFQVKEQGNGYFVELQLKGIGFKVFRFEHRLFLQLGFSHFYVYKIPSSLILKAKRDRIVIFGVDKDLVGSTAYDIFSLRKPDAYKAKGVQYKNKVYKLKEGKKK